MNHKEAEGYLVKKLARSASVSVEGYMTREGNARTRVAVMKEEKVSGQTPDYSSNTPSVGKEIAP